MKYLLIYDIDDYHSNGGGTYFQEFENLSQMDDFVNKELNRWPAGKFAVTKAIEYYKEHKYEPQEVVLKMKRAD